MTPGALYPTDRIWESINFHLEEVSFPLLQYVFHSVVSRNLSVIVQLSRVRLFDPVDSSTPGFPVLHYLPEFAQIHVH